MIGEFAARADKTVVRGEEGWLEAELGLPAEIVRPVLEGARARGMADAFELMGKHAIFFDGSGNVLHVAKSAEAHFGEELRLAGRQLVATGPDGNRVLQAVLGAALDGRAMEADLTGESGQGGLRLIGLPGPQPAQACQLLRAVLLLEPLEPGNGLERDLPAPRRRTTTRRSGNKLAGA